MDDKQNATGDQAPSARQTELVRHLMEPDIPFSFWWPLLGGAVLGVILRLIFSGKPGGSYAPMGYAFMYLAPMAVGAATVYIAERSAQRSWAYYFLAPVLATALFVLGTLLIMIEGIICAVIVIPLFSLLGACGGLLMGALCRLTRHGKKALYSFAALPIALGIVPDDGHETPRIAAIERSVIIAAPATRVWKELHATNDIRPDEVGRAWMYRIGVPLPLSGMTEHSAEGIVRKIRMGKDIRFDQVALEWEENRHVRWAYRFTENSIPPRALDDHVAIGGHYFDLIDTSYTLQPIDADTTRLRVRMSYRVSTQFNWYADLVARALIGNFEDVILEFYRRRATVSVAAAASFRANN